MDEGAETGGPEFAVPVTADEVDKGVETGGPEFAGPAAPVDMDGCDKTGARARAFATRIS